MDRMITSAEAREQFDDVVREVRAGATVTVTDEGAPAVQVVKAAPIHPSEEERAIVERQTRAWAEFLARTEDRPIQITGPWRREDLYD